MHAAALGVEKDRRAVGDRQQSGVDAGQHRQAHRAREDRDVRGRGPAHRADSGDPRRIESEELRRQQVAGDQDRARGQWLRHRFRNACEDFQQLQLEIAQVVGSRGEMTVFDRPQYANRLVHCRAPGESCAAAFRNALVGSRQQFRILEKLEMGTDDAGPRASISGSKPGELRAKARARVVEALHFFLCSGALHGHVGLAAGDAHRAAKGDALGGDGDGRPVGCRCGGTPHGQCSACGSRAGTRKRLFERSLHERGVVPDRMQRERVSVPRPKREQGNRAPGVDGPAAQRQVHLSAKLPETLRKDRGRTGVQAVFELHAERSFDPGACRCGRLRRCGGGAAAS